MKRLGQLTCCTIGVATGAGSLWATRARQANGEVLRIDPRTGHISARIRVGSGPSAIVAAGSLWVANTAPKTSLMRIDPHNNTVALTVEAGHGISDLAIGASGLWATENQQTAVRIDPASGRVLRRVAFPTTALQLAVGRGELWASAVNCRACAQGFVTRLRLNTGLAKPPLPVGKTPVALTIGGGALWVANFNSGTVTRIPLQA
jgi:DNA-binding beta-propeller fold protein YncE